jgi:hypothetical protein
VPAVAAGNRRSLSSTTAVLWYRPGARRSNSEATITTPSSSASAPSVSLVGPGTGSAWSKRRVSSVWQKYTPVCSSCSSTSCAPRACAARTPSMLAVRFWSRSSLHAVLHEAYFQAAVHGG